MKMPGFMLPTNRMLDNYQNTGSMMDNSWRYQKPYTPPEIVRPEPINTSFFDREPLRPEPINFSSFDRKPLMPEPIIPLTPIRPLSLGFDRDDEPSPNMSNIFPLREIDDLRFR